jgi:hypothetical protein
LAYIEAEKSFYPKIIVMADKYANLAVSDRVDEAVKSLDENPSLSLHKTGIIGKY